LPKQAHVYILGGWHNILGFMLLTRRPDSYAHITSIDIDPAAKPYADKINDCWCYDPLTARVSNITADVDTCTFDNNNAVYINSSSEHFATAQWFNNIPRGSLVCLQSISITEPGAPWHITMPNATMEQFVERYRLDNYLYRGTKRIQYNNWGYDRYMIIGHK